MTHRGHHVPYHVTTANFWVSREARARRGRGSVDHSSTLYFRCIRSSSRTFKGRCDHGLNKYSRRASTPSKVREEACTDLVLPSTRQTGAQGAQRRGERCWKISPGWEREAGANGRSAKRGNRTVLDCVQPKVWVTEEEADEDKKGGCKKKWSDGVEDSGGRRIRVTVNLSCVGAAWTRFNPNEDSFQVMR